jgi:hypothetical protein
MAWMNFNSSVDPSPIPSGSEYRTAQERVQQKARHRLFFLEAETVWELKSPADFLERESHTLLPMS